jgi:hypothetical protein
VSTDHVHRTIGFREGLTIRLLAIGPVVARPGAEAEFTLGIEEEYCLIDQATRDVVNDLATRDAARLRGIPRRAGAEVPRSHVEVGTLVCASPAEAHADLYRCASRHGADHYGDPSFRLAGYAKDYKRRCYADLQA